MTLQDNPDGAAFPETFSATPDSLDDDDADALEIDDYPTRCRYCGQALCDDLDEFLGGVCLSCQFWAPDPPSRAARLLEWAWPLWQAILSLFSSAPSDSELPYLDYSECLEKGAVLIGG